MRRIAPFLLVASMSPMAAGADEGMWTLDNFPARTVKERYGVDVDQAWLDRARGATVRLPGCTGSFVSADGLILTNNHCVWDCVADLSTPERNLSELGFLAAEREQEIQCPGSSASVLVDIGEVTGTVETAVAGIPDAEAGEARRRTLTRLEKECEDASRGERTCEAVSLYQGGQYFLYEYRRFEDVRLVFAPEQAIAAFGGDPDNFMFPRWCLDFSFLRAYDETGVPASTPVHLPWRAEGPTRGEVVLVTGHPGSTERLLAVAQLKYLRDLSLPSWLLRYSELRGRLLQWARTGDEPARIVQQRILRVENAIKVRRNQLFALLDDELFGRKVAEEERLRSAVAADPALQAAYGTAWQQMERAIERKRALFAQYLFVEAEAGLPGSLLRYARTLLRAAEERDKPNTRRLREYRETALPQLERQLLAAVPIHPELETLGLSFSLEKMLEWLGPDDPQVSLALNGMTAAERAEQLVAGSRLGDPGVRKTLWEGGAAAVRASRDPMIRLARALDRPARSIRKRWEDEVEAVEDRAAEKIARARFAVFGISIYPDATFTLRVTFGAVEGWLEQGEPVAPFTHTARLFERATGSPPFRLPASWRSARAALSPDTPFNYVATTDITGGNSGSPLIDQHGNLVGLAFDGNIHSIAGAYGFDPARNRTVAVHPAIMLEALREVYRASRLIGELTVVAPPGAE